jgi:hypothetical protein
MAIGKGQHDCCNTSNFFEKVKLNITCSACWGSNLGESCTNTQAPAIQGENRLLQAHLAQPVSDKFHSTSFVESSRKYLKPEII